MQTGLAAAANQSSFGLGNLLILLLPLLLLFWMMSMQRRRVRAMDGFQSSLQVGDEVVTAAGMHGRVAMIEGETVMLEIAPNTHVRFERRGIASRRPAPTAPPVDDATDQPGTDPSEGR